MQLRRSHHVGIALPLALSAALGACNSRKADRPVQESAGGNVASATGHAGTIPGATGLDTATGIDTTQQRGAAAGNAAESAAVESAGAANPATLTDAHIFALADDINSTEASAGEVAVGKATSAAVKSFAARMVRDHRALLNELHTVSSRKDVAPQATSDSTLIKAETGMLDTLRAASSGPSFDSLYIAHQIRAHQMAISAVRGAEQSAKDAQLKNLLASSLRILESHLQDAQRIQRELDQ